MNRNASAIWRGHRHKGVVAFATEREALSKTRYHFGASLEKTVATNPDELIAAALAGCFSMALAQELDSAGLHPHSIKSTATATVDESIVGGMISHLQLDVRAKVPDASPDQFVLAALAAKAHSPVVRLLKTTISMTASLDLE